MVESLRLGVQDRPEVRIFPPFCAGVGVYGRVGSGKSTQVRFIEEYFFTEGFKVIDIFDEGRLENIFITLPNPYKEQFSDFMRENPGWAPAGFPSECLIPAVPGIPKKVPEIFKPFRIRFSDLAQEELSILLGKLTPPEELAFNFCWYALREKKKVKSFADFLLGCEKILTSGLIRAGLNVRRVADESACLNLILKLNRLWALGLVCEDSDPWALDLDAVMRDRGIITCFSMAFISSKNIRHIILAYLLRKIVSLRKGRLYSKYPRLLLGHREIQKSAPARGKKSSYAYEGQSLSLEYFREIVEEPRDIEVMPVADSQDPLKVDSDIRKGFLTSFIFGMDLAVLNSMASTLYLDDKTYRGIMRLPMGACAVKTLPDPNDPQNILGIQYPCFSPPTRSMCKKPGDLFFQVWKDQGLKFIEIKVIRPEELIKVSLVSREEEAAFNVRAESVLMSYGKVLAHIIRGAPGVQLKGIRSDPLIASMGWDDQQLIKILNKLISEKVIRKDLKSRGYFAL